MKVNGDLGTYTPVCQATEESAYHYNVDLMEILNPDIAPSRFAGGGSGGQGRAGGGTGGEGAAAGGSQSGTYDPGRSGR